MSDGVQAKLGDNTPVTLGANESKIVEAVGDFKEGTWLDFGLYGKGSTLLAPAGVTIKGDDYYESGVFTFGPSGVAHLYTQDRNITLTCGENPLGEFFVVVKLPKQSNFPKMASSQKKTAA